MLSLQYEGDIYRPPSEANSLILQATIGCSHNRCTFCASFIRKKFRERSLEEISRDITIASSLLPYTRRIFLADGNALTIPTPKLLQILRQLDDAFPSLERVSVYGNTQDLLNKSVTELNELGSNKLGMIYLGLESGSAAILEAVKKGVTPEQMIEGTARAKAAGIPLSITVINGLAGVEGMVEHARATASLLNEIDPAYLGLLSLMVVPGTIMHRQLRNGLFTMLNPWQLLDEIKMMVEGLNLTNCVFRANHASNYLPLKATLSRDKEKLLKTLDQIIAKRSPSSLKSEFMRGL
jgi:radical SAM superfamily enzyme YgiQ (UPF0313 family)